METTIKAAKAGGRWIAFREDADLSDIDEAKIEDWRFVSLTCTTGSLIRVSDGVVDFDLARDSKGFPDAGAYASAYDVSFAVVHLRSVAGPDVHLDDPNRAQVESLPLAVLREYVYRADISRSVTKDDIDSLRKPKVIEAGNTESAEKKGVKAKAF